MLLGSSGTVTVVARPDPAVAREWDRFVELSPGADVAQLSSWARVHREAGFHPLYLLAYQDGRLVGGALVLERPLPGLGRIGNVSNGPVIATGVLRQPVLDRLVFELDTLRRHPAARVVRAAAVGGGRHQLVQLPPLINPEETFS